LIAKTLFKNADIKIIAEATTEFILRTYPTAKIEQNFEKEFIRFNYVNDDNETYVSFSLLNQLKYFVFY